MAMPFNTNTPHDRLMKKIAEKAPRIRAIIDDHVAPLRGMVKGDPHPVSENFTDSESLLGIHCDIAVQVDLEHGPPNKAVVIFEHKSVPDDLTPLQLLKYATAYLDRYVGGDPEKMKDLPSILPVILYHGKRKWDMPECLDVSLGEGDAAAGLTVRFIFINLSEMSKEELSSDASVRAAFYAMLYVCGALEGDNLLDDVIALMPDDDLGFAVTLVRYIIAIGKDSKEAVESAVRRIKPKLGGVIMGNAYREIMAEGKAEQLAQQLQHRFGSVPSSVQDRLEQAAPEELEAWGVRIFDAESPEAIFSD